MGRQLASVQSDLEESKRLATLGMLVAVVAHELNNVLAPVVTYAQLSRAHPNDLPMMRKAVDRAAAGAQQAIAISKSVLVLARDGALPPEQAPATPTDVKAAVVEVLEHLGEDLERAGVRVSVTIDAGLSVAMGRVGFQQVITNLVLNARKAVGDRGGRIDISARPAMEKSFDDVSRSTGNNCGWVRVTVGDSGQGLAEDVRSRMLQA